MMSRTNFFSLSTVCSTQWGADELGVVDPHVRHNIAAGHGHWGRRTHRAERDRRTRELFLPAAQCARNDIEVAEEVIDAQQIRERGACRATDVVSGRQYRLHLVMAGGAEHFQTAMVGAFGAAPSGYA